MGAVPFPSPRQECHLLCPPIRNYYQDQMLFFKHVYKTYERKKELQLTLTAEMSLSLVSSFILISWKNENYTF